MFPAEMTPILVALSDLLLMVRLGEPDEQIVEAARNVDAALFSVAPNRTLREFAVSKEAHTDT